MFNQNAKGDYSLAGGGVKEVAAGGLTTLAYAGNVFEEGTSVGGPMASIKTEDGWLQKDAEKLAFMREHVNFMNSDFGEHKVVPLLQSPEQGDFRPAAAGQGVRFFVPWSLSGTVGEWGFRRCNESPTRIIGENYYMTDEYGIAKNFDKIPRNHLTAPHATTENYGAGVLEDWHAGAFVFDGNEQYAVLRHSDMSADYPLEPLYSKEIDKYFNHKPFVWLYRCRAL